jgi:serine/threonine protein phosphatase PrpC
MRWHITSRSVQIHGQDDSYIEQINDDEYLCVIIDGHGENRQVVDHVMKRLPEFSLLLKSPEHSTCRILDFMSALSDETRLMHSGACVTMAHLCPQGDVHTASLGDAPSIWGSIDFQSITDIRYLQPHTIDSNIRERTRVLISGGKIVGTYMLSPDGKDLLQLTRALGDVSFRPLLMRVPEYAEINLSEGDFLLLCTDGFCDIRMPPTKTCIAWRNEVARRADAAEMVAQHMQRKGLYDDTTAIVAYRY